MKSSRQFTMPWLLVLVLAACETAPPNRGPSADPILLPGRSSEAIDKANQLYYQGRKREAAEAYFNASRISVSPDRERLQLQAAEVASMLPDLALMERYLRAVDVNRLNAENRARYDYAKALIALDNNQPKIALDLLPAQYNNIPAGLAGKIRATRLKAANDTGNHLLIARERIVQDKYLQGKNRVNNRKQIWTHLSKLSANQLDNQRIGADNSLLRGWFDLAWLYKQYGTDAGKVARWRERFPAHPALDIASSLSAGGTSSSSTNMASINATGKPIAILLPQTGSLSPYGSAITAGILAAHKQAGGSVSIKQFDTSATDSSVLYDEAYKNGAGFVLGPFDKQRLDSLAANGFLPVPALSMNYLDSNQSKPANMIEFGLLPEDEAIQVGLHTANKGLDRAAVIVPDSAWGQRLENAFGRAYRDKGGIIVETLRYPNRATGYNSEVSDLMGRVKGSVDVIFLAASPTQARLIHAELSKQNSDNVPVYATSHIFSGRPYQSLDSNLNGIIYTETPWVLETISQNGSHSQYPRLYALGLDAFMISQNLPKLQGGSTLSGKTGLIRYASNGKLHRELQWATFENGLPKPYAP